LSLFLQEDSTESISVNKRESFSQKQFLFDRSFWSVHKEDEHYSDQYHVRYFNVHSYVNTYIVNRLGKPSIVSVSAMKPFQLPLLDQEDFQSGVLLLLSAAPSKLLHISNYLSKATHDCTIARQFMS